MTLTTKKLFIAFLFIALFVMTAREIADPDFWWHLSTGKYIVETQSIPHTDPFSFTKAGSPWVAHEWLAQVFIYALYSIGSFPLLIVVFSAIITLAFALVFARSDGKPYVATTALLLAALATAPTWGVRPQMISLLLMSVFLWVLDTWTVIASREPAKQSPSSTLEIASSHKPLLAMTKRILIWSLPPLMILWVNLHSGYALGLAIIAVYLLGEIVNVIASRVATKQSPIESDAHAASSPSFDSAAQNAAPLRTLLAMTEPNAPLLPRSLAIVFVLCLIAVLINPNGATMYTYPFETLTSPTMQTYIQEWFSPDFHLVEFQPFAWLLLATLAVIALSGKRATLTQTLLLAGTAYAGLRSARNIPLFAVVAAPILAEHLWQIVESRGWAKTLSPASVRTTRGMSIINWVLLLIIALAGIVRVAMVVSNQDAVVRAKFPVAAVDFLQSQNISGALYNSYDWGGYLIWRFASRPQTRVFIDGRADVYGDKFIEDVYLKAYRGGADWREPLDRYDVRVVLIEPDAPLASQLATDAVWQKVYEDKQAVVFEKR